MSACPFIHRHDGPADSGHRSDAIRGVKAPCERDAMGTCFLFEFYLIRLCDQMERPRFLFGDIRPGQDASPITAAQDKNKSEKYLISGTKEMKNTLQKAIIRFRPALSQGSGMM
jgi:hypothetical protein